MFGFSTLCSSSAANALLLEAEGRFLLLDIGPSYKRIRELLAERDMDPSQIEGILLTHEHIDHIGGLRVFLKHHPVPVYATPGTVRGILATPKFECMPEECFSFIHEGECFQAAGMRILPIPVSHDALEPVAYRIWAGGKSAAFVTDLGYYTEAHVRALQELDGLYLEANHDLRMLETGPYPYSVKTRIAGDSGHLSNETAGQLLSCLIHTGLKKVLLGHLSEQNNYPLLAVESVKAELLSAGVRLPEDFYLASAPCRGWSDRIIL